MSLGAYPAYNTLAIHFSSLWPVPPDARSAAAERVDRARLKSQIGDRDGAAADLRAVLETVPTGPQEARIRDALKALENRP